MKYLTFASLFLFTIAIVNESCIAQQLALTSNGSTSYSIVSGADPKESQAARILHDYLKKMSGVEFNILNSRRGNSIFILTSGEAQKMSLLLQSQVPGEEGITIKTLGKDVYIIGGAGNGLSNAVYEFLEKYLGCRYYTADAILIPANKDISIPSNINYTYTPAIKYRFLYFGPAFQGDYPAWNKLQNTSGGKVSLPAFGLWVHSMFTLVPPAKYFNSHPEYYALRDGKRVKTQLDLTNPDVLQIARRSLDSIIKINPHATIFSVSQMDNNGYCECDNCRRKAAQTGSQSGVILNFVNQLAAAFPAKTISMLAYNYSRSAPASLKPAKNVNIMFCATGANRSIPFNANKSKGSVYADLTAWSKLTGNIFFWDYLVDFRHLYLPFPIYHTLQPNIRFLAANNISYTFQQGWAYRGSDMPELKTYLIAKLLWNPDIDIKATQDEFINFYYGNAAPYISKYINALTNYVQSHNLNLSTDDAPLDHINDYLSPSQLKIYQQYFLDAEKAVAKNTVYFNRVQNAGQSVRYTILDGVSKSDTNANNTHAYETMLSDFKNIAELAKADRVEEGNTTLNEFVEDQRSYQKRKLIKNLADGASVIITTPASYTINNINALFDNIVGNKTIDNKWVSFQEPYIELVINLKKQLKIDSVYATFMHNPAFKIQLPESVKYAVSDDGKSFRDVGVAKNIWAGLGVKEELKRFGVSMPSDTKAQYIRMSFKMVNSPNIAGDGLPQSMLCDEIIVQ